MIQRTAEPRKNRSARSDQRPLYHPILLNGRAAARGYHGRVARQAAIPRPAKRRPLKESSKHSSLIIVLIGIFKLFKAILLLVVAIGAARLLHKDLAATALHWTQVLRVDPDNRYVHGLLARIFRVTPKQLKELSVGTFIYAGLFATEGTGLLLRKRWAEYFTIITTGCLLPVEFFELARHFTVAKLAITIVNLLIVWFLVARVRSR